MPARVHPIIIMQESIHISSGTQIPAALCNQCGTMQMRLKADWSPADRLAAWLICLYPFVCVRCASSGRKLRFTWRQAVTLLVVSAMTGSAFYIRRSSGFFRKESSDSQIEMLARTRTAMGGELSSLDQIMIHKPRQTMDNASVLKLCKANVSANIILNLIRNSNAEYDLSANSIIALKSEGVDQSIILAMIDANYSPR
jgi:hypothetical protein